MVREPPLIPVPTPEAVAEAKKNPGGWVYAIRGNYSERDHVPASAVIGAWKVDDEGEITDEFLPNPNFEG